MSDTSASRSGAQEAQPGSTPAASLLVHERDMMDILRKRFTQSLLLACAAGLIWHFGVQPLEKAHAVQQSTKASLEAKISIHGSVSSADARLDGEVKSMNAKFTDVTRWTTASADPAALYEAINALAATHHVTIQRIEPSGPQDVVSTADASASAPARRGRRAAPAATTGKDTTKWRARTMSHRMSVIGTYEAICEFVGACEHDLGASKVRSIAIRQSSVSSNAPDRVSAEIETVHLELRKPEVPERMQGNSTSGDLSSSPEPAPLSQETPK